MKSYSWLAYALITTIFWGVWGALIEIPEKRGFPATMGYTVWALTMIVPAVIALRSVSWKIETKKKGMIYGLLIGLLGSCGQLILFEALKTGPAYLVFPIVSLSPLITIFMSLLFLKEKAARKTWIGIVLALLAIPLLSYQEAGSGQSYEIIWLVYAMFVFIAWGVQAFLIKLGNEEISAESIFFYMTVSSILLIPIALYMTDFSVAINWDWDGPYLTAGIQVLNSIGALCLVYAFRHGKAIVVSPMTNAGAPVITIVLSLVIYGVFPNWILVVGMVLAIIAVLLMAD